jgi:twitching motility protein PilU
MPINQQIMDPETIQRMAYEMLTRSRSGVRDGKGDQRLLRHPRHRQFPREHVLAARHHRHRGALHPGRDPRDELHLPPVLTEVIMEKRGLVLVVGSTGSGKSTTLAAMIDHRNAQQVGPHPDGGRPDRISLQAQEVGRQPARDRLDTKAWENALKNAHAPGAGLHPHRRDPRQGNHGGGLAYAQTGHLCLATLHANNSYHALNRIINFYPLENRPALYLDLS